jgi:hypothetical protein
MKQYNCQLKKNKKTGLPIFTMTNTKSKKGEECIMLTTKDLEILYNNLHVINRELQRLQLLNTPEINSIYRLPLGRTKSFRLTKKRGKVICGFCRPSILTNGKRCLLAFLVSDKKWKMLNDYLLESIHCLLKSIPK